MTEEMGHTFPGNDYHLGNPGPLLKELINTGVDIFREERDNRLGCVIDNAFRWPDDCACACSLSHRLLYIFQLHGSDNLPPYLQNE